MSLHTRSCDVGWTPYVIFMVPPWQVPTAVTEMQREGAGFAIVECCIKNEEHHGYITQARFFARFAYKLNFWQDQVIYLGNPDHCSRRAAYAVHKSGAIRHLGRLQSVRRDEALATGTWFYRPAMDTYFIAKEQPSRPSCFSEELMGKLVVRAMLHEPLSIAAE